MSKLFSKTKNAPILSLGFASLILFLILNILSSQNVSPLYSQLMKEDQKAGIDFLTKIQHLQGFTDFNTQLNDYKLTFGEDVINEVLKEDQKKQTTIKDLKEILNKNHSSRDVLYSLYLLEKEEGNKTEAEMYLQKAKKIDPLL